jgi:hypothetical protein
LYNLHFKNQKGNVTMANPASSSSGVTFNVSVSMDVDPAPASLPPSAANWAAHSYSYPGTGHVEIWAARQLHIYSQNAKRIPPEQFFQTKPITAETFYPAGTRVIYQGQETTIHSWVSPSMICLSTGDSVQFSHVIPALETGDKALIQDINDKERRYFGATIDKVTPATISLTWEGFEDEKGKPISTFVRKVRGVALRVLPMPGSDVLRRIPSEGVQFANEFGNSFGKICPGYIINPNYL